MANSYLNKTMGAGNRQTWTWSAWIKRSKIGSEQNLWGVYVHGNDNMRLFFTSGDVLEFKFYNGTSYKVETSRVFRDTNAWYHIVCVADTTNSTEADRLQLWVNGERQSGGGTQPTQNLSMSVNDSNAFEIGRYNSGGYFDGYMSHVAFVDGTALTPTSFGQTDSTSGIWKFKSPSGLSWGTNGFHLKMENSGNLGLDSSGQSNTYTVNGNLKQALDTPSNVYATLNPLDTGLAGNSVNLANGNNTTMNKSGWGDYGLRSTLGVSKGKWYWEVKNAAVNGAGANTMGVLKMDKRLVINLMANPATADVFGIQRYDDTKTNIYSDGTFTSQNTAMWGGITTSDVISFALDMDNGKLYLAKNGAFKDSSGNTSNPATAAYPTFTGIDSGEYYGFYSELRMNNDNGLQVNFGNGFFGTTAITSAGSNGNGSLFEYDVPSGYYALNTKNINTYG